MNAPGKAVILGGAGVFGSRLARMLLADGWQVVVTSRSLANGQAFTRQYGGQNTVWSRGDSLAPLLDGAFLVVDAAGPFQAYGAGGLDVARAAMKGGVHYFDLSDDASFTQNIKGLDEGARAKSVTLFSGMSSVPALSSAAVTGLSQGMSTLKSIEIAILPGNRAPRGLSVMRAILGQVGAPLRVWRDGRWQNLRAWSEPRRYTLAPGLKRRAALIGAPDLALFPDYYNAESVVFRAGLELGIMQYSLAALSWLRAHRLAPNPARLTRPLHWLAERLESLGTDRGGMVVMVTSGTGEERRWTLLAEAGDGPFIPAIPAVIAARKLARGDYAPGARPALDVFTLDEAKAELGRLNTTTD